MKIDGNLWAITSYFNPAAYARRRENYRRFRQALAVPLIAVELAWEGKFELGRDDAEVLIPLQGGDVMWQKERMMNLALRSLPPQCREVVLIDCDVVFADADWWMKVPAVLESVPMMQCFGRVQHLTFGATALSPAQAVAQQFSLPEAVAKGFTAQEAFDWPIHRKQTPCAPGGAVAFRRDVIEQHGLYDACIIGGADLAVMAGAYGCFEQAATALAMTPRQREHYLAWAEPFLQSIGANVGLLPGDLYHLWHGRLSDRRYVQRHRELARLDFDPAADLELSAEGLWRWKSDKPALRDYLKGYFASREEDHVPGLVPGVSSVRTDDLSSFGGATFKPMRPGRLND